ncbi:efflux RND transporter periplasmic adaptor subunit [Solitalea koreensis]|uniref:HlyD family secretion protein n=1 Tax=Solitalea koreensis TaxID=543615 RepID=A0A521DJA2_9SPHI|nr:efflux RND transporter periplasmic adaptor subunit [Solitalea koreensis]SMO71181.1 HlyD family secretion protein [Solitalea koreensis]
MNKKNNTLWYLLSSAALLIVLAAVGKKQGWFWGNKETEVAVEKVAKRTIVETVSASGKIQPETEVKLSPEVSGEIVELYVKEGERVKKGQLLVRIRPDFYASDYSRSEAIVNEVKANMANSAARLAASEATFKNVQSSFSRSKKLYEEKVISQSEYDAALAQYEQAKQDVQAARQSLEAAKYNVASSQATLKQSGVSLAKTTIYAPMDGVVSMLSVERGERVLGTAQMQGTEIMRIADLKTMEAVVDVNENDINRVALQDTADVEVDAYLGKKFKGVVTEIANSATSGAGVATTDQVTNFKVKVRLLPSSYEELMNAGEQVRSPFRPGLSSTVDIHTHKVDNALSVPIQSVTTRQNEEKDKNGEAKMLKTSNDGNQSKVKNNVLPQEIVFVIREGVVKAVPVKTGIQDDSFIEIKSGLTNADKVVIAPYLAISKDLKDGDKIKEVEKEKLFSPDKK